MEDNQGRVRWKDIETGLGSLGRIKILRKMIERPEGFFTKYALERETGLKPVDVRNNLKVLVELSWIKEYPYDPKTYSINMENEAVKLIAEFFRKVKR